VQTQDRLRVVVELFENEASGFDLSSIQQTWLERRWYFATASAIDAMVPQGSKDRWTQALALSGSLGTPILASYNAAGSDNNWVRYLLLVVSFAVAILTAVRQSFRFHSQAVLNWSTAGSLEDDAWACLKADSAPYIGLEPPKRFAMFAAKADQTIAGWSRAVVGPDADTKGDHKPGDPDMDAGSGAQDE
jgi:hypothetical protein